MVATCPIYRRPLLLVVAATLAIAGCATSDAGTPERLTACELLNRAQVSEILGGPVGRPAASRGNATDALAGRSGCAWATLDDDAAVLVELVRTADMADEVRRTGFSAAARFDAARGQHPQASDQAGLGDRAIYVEETAELHVLAGRSYLTFEVAARPPERGRALAVALASRAVARLQRGDQAD